MPDTEAINAMAPRRTGAPASRGTVYIVQATDIEVAGNFGKFSKASRYGDLVPLMQRDAFPDNADERIMDMREVMRAKLKAFNPLRDYVLLTGDPLAIAMCILTLSCFTLAIQCLKWDRDEQDYYPVLVSI